MSDFNHRAHVDRQQELGIFRELIKFSSPARLLTICDKGACGKSWLLKYLQYNCGWEFKPPIPACLIELQNFAAAPTAKNWAFVAKLAELLDQIVVDETPMDETPMDKTTMLSRFPRFNRFYKALIDEDWNAFCAQSAPPGPSVAGVQASVKVEGSVAPDGQVAGIVNEFKGPGPVTFYQQGTRGFTDQQKSEAQKRCIGEFFADLREVCKSQPIVILLDTWDGCDGELREWLGRYFLCEFCFNSHKSLRPDKLIVVITSRPYDPNDDRGRNGLHPDDLRLYLRGEQELSATPLPHTLGSWHRDDIRTLMANNGLPRATEQEIDLVQSNMDRGWTILQALKFIEMYRAISPPG